LAEEVVDFFPDPRPAFPPFPPEGTPFAAAVLADMIWFVFN
jgi:hypothetical protein